MSFLRVLICLLFAGTLLAQGDREGVVLKIVDENGVPLPFATVELPDGNQILVADGEGELTIVGEDRVRRIRVSYLGFEETTMNIPSGAGPLTVRLQPVANVLIATTVVGRRDEPASDLVQAVRVVPTEAARRVQSLTTADQLAALGGVHVQKSQLGGGSPVVRGFEANRVLLVVDGVRLNNAIFRAGHLQNAITIDPNTLDRTELLLGPGALAYGSDAIGGVIHFRTVDPGIGRGTGGRQGVNFATAANALNLGGHLRYGGKRWGAVSGYGYTNFGDLRAGANRPAAYPDFGLRTEYVVGDRIVANPEPNVQVGSGYAQFNLLQKFVYAPLERLSFELNLQYSTTSDVPRYDALIERRGGRLRWARWEYGPQTRLLTSLRMSDRRPTRLYDLAVYQLAHNYNAEDRIQRRLGDPLTEYGLVDVGATTLQVDFDKQLGDEWRLRYGGELRYERIAAEAYLEDDNSGERNSLAVEPRYPGGGSTLGAGGAYVDLGYRLNERWRLRSGLRYAVQRLDTRFTDSGPVDWPAGYLAGVTNVGGSLTGALGANYSAPRLEARLSFAQGFRAPNLDDFAKFREQNGRIQVPNLTLGAERSNSLEGGLTIYPGRERKHYLGLVAYLTHLDGAIVRRDGGTLPGGGDRFVSRGDTLIAQTNVNADRAWVYGGDLVARFTLSDRLMLDGGIHYLRGRRRQQILEDLTTWLPQDHIPPTYGHTGVSYAYGSLRLDVRVDFQLAKAVEDYAVNSAELEGGTVVYDRTGTSDNLELTPVDPLTGAFVGSYGWYTLNAYASYEVGKFTLRLKGENLADRHYRTFASGISAAGRDLGVGVEYVF